MTVGRSGGWTFAEAARFFETYGFMPVPTRGGEGEEKPVDRQVIFKSQEDLDEVIKREKAKAADAAKKDPALIEEITKRVREELSGEIETKRKQDEGKNGELLADVLSVKKGAIPEDSELGKTIKNLYGRVKDTEDVFESIIEEDLSKLPDAIKDLMPDDLDAAQKAKWIKKALKVEASKSDEEKEGEKKTGEKKLGNGHKDPPKDKNQKQEFTVDQTLDEMRKNGMYGKR